MKALLVSVAVIGMTVSGAAFAQSSTSSSAQAGSQPNASSGANLVTAQKLAQDLQKSGFSDVKVVAESFVIQAKTKDGDPVVMTVGPHGMSAFEAITPDKTGTTGSTNSQSGTSNMNAPSGTMGSSQHK